MGDDELKQALLEAFHAGCKVGFEQGLEGAAQEAQYNGCPTCKTRIEDVCGPNIFAVLAAFDRWWRWRDGGRAD